jgi:hypothetical protein
MDMLYLGVVLLHGAQSTIKACPGAGRREAGLLQRPRFAWGMVNPLGRAILNAARQGGEFLIRKMHSPWRALPKSRRGTQRRVPLHCRIVTSCFLGKLLATPLTPCPPKGQESSHQVWLRPRAALHCKAVISCFFNKLFSECCVEGA